MDQKSFDKLYVTQREKLLNWGLNRHALDKDILLDLYQDAFVILHRHWNENKFENQNINIEAYLFGIFQHLILQKLKIRGKKNYSVEINDDLLGEVDNYYERHIDRTDLQIKIDSALSKLGENCKTLLTLF